MFCSASGFLSFILCLLVWFWVIFLDIPALAALLTMTGLLLGSSSRSPAFGSKTEQEIDLLCCNAIRFNVFNIDA